MWQVKKEGALSVEKKYISFVSQNFFQRCFPPLPTRGQGSCGILLAPQANAGVPVAPLQPAQQERWQGCWSCSLKKGGWEKLPPLPHSRSPLHPLFHQFSPLAIRWLVAEKVCLVSPAAGFCVAITSRQYWCPTDDEEVAACEQSRLSLKNTLATHAWNPYFFFSWKIKSSEVGKCQISVCLTNPNSAWCLCVLLRSSVAFITDSFFPKALIHMNLDLVTKSTLWN